MILDVHPIDFENINYTRYPAAITKSYYFGLFFYFALAGAIVWVRERFFHPSEENELRLQSLPVIWLFFLFLYLQWGSSSLDEYTPTFKLITYLTVLTAPGALLASRFVHWAHNWLSPQRKISFQKVSSTITISILAFYTISSIGCAVVNHIGNGPFKRDQTYHFTMKRILNQYPVKTIYTDGWTARLLAFAFAYERELLIFDMLDPYDKRTVATLENMDSGYALINYRCIEYAPKAFKNKTYPSFLYDIPQHWKVLVSADGFSIYNLNQ